MKCIGLEVGNPAAFGDMPTITAGNDEITLSCSSVSGTSTVKVTMMRTTQATSSGIMPTAVTSEEFDILANRIGDIDDLTTTANTDVVAAVNELKTSSDDHNTAIGSMSSQISALNASSEYNGASAASLTAAIEAAVDALANDSKMHVITVTRGAKVILLVQKYSSGAYASYVGFCYALTNPISGEKVNGTWTHSSLALDAQIATQAVQTYVPSCPANCSVYNSGCYYQKAGNVVTLYMSFKMENVTQAGFQGRVTITHNLPNGIKPTYTLTVFGDNGDANGYTSASVTNTYITIFPQRTGTTYFYGVVTYVV